MGMGHLFRMINFHEALTKFGVEAVFVLTEHHEPAKQWLASKGLKYCCIDIEAEPLWERRIYETYKPIVWVNDRLDTSAEHAQLVKSMGIKLVTVDDYGSGASYADFHVAALAECRQLKPEGKTILIGIDYLILPKEIEKYRRLRTQPDRLIVNLGGSDTYGMTVRVVDYLRQTNRPATVILGPGFLHEDALNEALFDGIVVKRSVPSLVAEFANYDIAITGGGLTAFEAAAAGLPTLTVANEKHETEHCHFLESLECSIYSGYLTDADFNLLRKMEVISPMSMMGMEKVSLMGAENICMAISNH